MMKRFLYTLIVCFVAMSQSVVLAALPIIPSTNTEDGAHWYRIRSIRQAAWEQPAYLKARGLGVNIGMVEFEEDSDEMLWCFIGSEAKGFQIYNKAFLFNDARVIVINEGWGFLQLAEATTAWNYTWEFVSGEVAGNVLWSLRSEGGRDGKANVLHAWRHPPENEAIFYGSSATDGYGCAWLFEDASLPVIPSIPILPIANDANYGPINTKEHLDWYRIKNVRNASGTVPPYMRAVDLGVNIGTAPLDNTNNVLWCFIGNAVDGYQIYNRAFLNDKARVIAMPDPWPGFIQLATDAIEWKHSWEFVSQVVGDVTAWGLRSEGGRDNELLHGWQKADANYAVIFYGTTPAADDFACSWLFELPTEVPVDFKTLEALILECTAQVAEDKEDPYNVQYYGEGIAIFEEAIASAQDVVDDPDATQPDVNLAVIALKKAKLNYALAYIDLPFEESKNGTWNWYKIKSERTGPEDAPAESLETRYWSYNPLTMSVTAVAGDDNSDDKLWAFTGNNFTGINIYNKAGMEDGARLVSLDVIGISSLPWDGAWKLDMTVVDGAYWYGIVNANGRFNETTNKFTEYIHTRIESDLVFYGFPDNHSGSLYDFEFVSTTGIPKVSKDAPVVFAKDGKIYVRGTESTAAIYSLTGGLIAVSDVQHPSAVAVKGVYIVRVDGKAYKVVVQ